MLLERVVYAILCVALFLYISQRCFKSKISFMMVLLAFQVIGLMVEILTLFANVYPDKLMLIFIFMFNVFFPSIIFLFDYRKVDASELFLEDIGDFYMRRQNYEKAIRNYLRIADSGKGTNKLFVKLGTAYNAIGDRRTAFDKFAKAIELDRNDYQSYYEIGIIFNAY